MDPEAGYFETFMGANVAPRKGFVKIAITPKRLRSEFVGSTSMSGYSDSFTIGR